MRLKSFYGATMTEAMRQVREALGDNAIIVATRDDEMGGVRVTAAIDEPLSVQEKITPPPVGDEADSEILDVIASALVQHQVPAPLAEKLLASATQFAAEDALLSLGAAFDVHFKFQPLSLDKPAKPFILIGPPGAGKTLCTAKLATQATLGKLPVGVISTDTERAGGMEQLGAFIRLLKLDLVEIEDSHALQDAIGLQKDGTTILIDTAGCNPFDNREKQKLAGMIAAAKATPVLVLPADLDRGVALDMLKEFQSVGAESLLFTRLDMTRRIGTLLTVAHEAKLPLCAYSASSKVTEQPQLFNPVSLARLILPRPREEAPRQATGTL